MELLGVDGGTYISSMEGSINFEDDVAGTLVKSVVFGALVGTIATYRGFTRRAHLGGRQRGDHGHRGGGSRRRSCSSTT